MTDHELARKPPSGGGGHTPGVGWLCTGCHWRFSYDVPEERARRVWLADTHHQGAAKADPEHLVLTMTDRGFTHLPPIKVWAGYEAPTGSLEELQTHEVGEVRVYESSDAMFPSIWLSIKAANAIGETVDEAVHLTVANAHKLGEQLVYLVSHHYSGGGS